MDKQLTFADVAHYYVNSKILVRNYTGCKTDADFAKANSAKLDYRFAFNVTGMVHSNPVGIFARDLSMVKPYLHRLDNLTDEQYMEIIRIGHNSHIKNPAQGRELLTTYMTHQSNVWGQTWLEIFHYLISIGADVFGLIKSGNAFDHAVLTPEDFSK